MIDNLINDYIKKLMKEKEYLAAVYIEETGFKPSEICIVEQATPIGRVFYFEHKSKYEPNHTPSAEKD